MKKRTEHTPDKLWDTIIVGGGPAGMTAALTLARMRHSVLLCDAGHQRNACSHGMHNYLTRDGILPTDYLDIAYKELAQYRVTQMKVTITKAWREDEFLFKVTDALGVTHSCKRLLIATGVTDNIPEIPGMRELWGASVHHCPYCDGWECRDTTIGLYASKLNGYGMTLALGCLARDIILFTDGAHYIRGVQAAQLLKRGVRVITDHVEELVYENENLLGVKLAGGSIIPCEKMFVNHGHKINGDLLQQLGCRCSRKGAAITNRKQQTSVSGVYAAGDATIDVHFVVVAAAEGAKAAVSIHTELMGRENEPALKYKEASADAKE